MPRKPMLCGRAYVRKRLVEFGVAHHIAPLLVDTPHGPTVRTTTLQSIMDRRGFPRPFYKPSQARELCLDTPSYPVLYEQRMVDAFLERVVFAELLDGTSEILHPGRTTARHKR